MIIQHKVCNPRNVMFEPSRRKPVMSSCREECETAPTFISSRCLHWHRFPLTVDSGVVHPRCNEKREHIKRADAQWPVSLDKTRRTKVKISMFFVHSLIDKALLHLYQNNLGQNIVGIPTSLGQSKFRVLE
jgi:hypothetical protein